MKNSKNMQKQFQYFFLNGISYFIKNNMKYILLSLSVVLLFSCSSQKETISDFSSSEPTQEKKLILAL